jgi:hypothetical protein
MRMWRFRTQWLALFGALVILSLSLGSAFGARPIKADGESLTFGQQVSAFVHSLQSADQDGDEDQDENPADDCDIDEDGAEDSDDSTDEVDEADESEDAAGEQDGTEACDTDEDADEDADQDDSDEDSEDSEETEDSADSAASNHGHCVAEVAHDPEAVGENGTHGWAVSEAARVTCWQEFADPDDADTDDDSEGTEEAIDESDASQDGANTDKPHGKSAEAHQRKQDRGSGKPSWAGMSAGGHGYGKAHGHGKGGPHH